MTRPFWALIAVAMTVGWLPPALAQTPSSPPPPPAAAPPAVTAPQAPLQSADPFGEDITLAPKTIIYLKGTGTWDTAFETLVDAFKSVNAFLDKQGVKRAGPPMTIYTKADDTGFEFQAAVPVDEPPKDMPKGDPKGDITIGQSPAGKALKFVHRGSYDAMDNTYEAITNYLDEKQLEARDVFIEEYVTDPIGTPEDRLVINVYVPVK